MIEAMVVLVIAFVGFGVRELLITRQTLAERMEEIEHPRDCE